MEGERGEWENGGGEKSRKKEGRAGEKKKEEGERVGEGDGQEERERERASKMVTCLQSDLRSNIITSLLPYSFRRESRGPAHSQRFRVTRSVHTRRRESLVAISETADSNWGLKTSP